MLKLSTNSRNALVQKAAGMLALHRPHELRQKLEGPRLFIGLVGCCILLLVIWGSLAKIDRVVRVEGKVIPAGRSREIQHLEGGIIASIDTHEGATVKKGDLLLTIDDTTAHSNLGEDNVKYNAQRARAARLQAEVDGAATINFPADIASTPTAQEEQHLFVSRKAKLEQEVVIEDATIREKTARLNEAIKRRGNLKDELTVAHQRSQMMAGMEARNAASKLEVLEAQSREERLQTEKGDTENSIPTLQASIAEDQARISTHRAEFHNDAQNELVTTLAEIDRLKQLLVSANDRVNRTDVRAPMDGIINRISVNTVGGVIKSGESLIELIPVTKEVLIEARAQPRDRGYLKPGLEATVRISAYDVGELGLLKSRVTEVSADTVQEARGDPYYRVNLLVSDVPASYSNLVMVPGMTVTADIVTGRRTAIGYLLSPLRKFTYNIFRDSR